MALNDTDRRRFLLATVVTIVAFPAMLWANRSDESTRPNVATAGVEIGGPETDHGHQTSPLVVEPVGDRSPVYLQGPDHVASPAVADIAVPASRELTVRQNATYSSALAPGRCLAKGASTGERVRIVNLENNRSVTCVVTFASAEQREDLVMSRVAFLELADLTDAPVPVEIRQ